MSCLKKHTAMLRCIISKILTVIDKIKCRKRVENMNKGQIESTAIATLKMLINSCETLKDYVVDNDKTPTWDGNIFLFGDKTHTKKDVRKIPVQVKGTTIGKLDSQTITHAVRREELQNYLAMLANFVINPI